MTPSDVPKETQIFDSKLERGMDTTYEKLRDEFEDIGKLSSIQSLLFWDRAVNLPESSIDLRAEQFSFLKRLRHNKLSSVSMAAALQPVMDDLGDWDRANLREMKRMTRRTTAISEQLLEEVTEASARCEMKWRKAKHQEDFDVVEPALARVVELKQRVARQKSDALDVDPYQALVDEYSPGIDIAEIDTLFDQLRSELPDRIDAITQNQPPFPELPASESYPIETQKALVEELMSDLGFDFERGRLDTSEHAFCGGSPRDIRMTTTYDESDPLEAITTTLHETGHALYNKNLPENWRFQPVGQSRGMALHESQSLLVEQRIGRSKPFCRYLSKKLASYFPNTELSNWDAGRLYNRLNHVRRSPIRIEADEVTYPLHVIWRYELERDLINGDIEAKDLPALWSDKMHTYLGIRPDRPSEGVLQDIHWMQGAFGYFPSYALGAVLAAQFFKQLRNELQDLKSYLEAGKFGPIVEWLSSNIHQFGSRYSTTELVENVTGHPLTADDFLELIDEKYL